MALRQLRGVLVMLVVFTGTIVLVAGFWSQDAVAAPQSNRPPFPPVLRDEPRTSAQISSASVPNCPVVTRGVVALGQTTSGEGLLTLKNVGDKPIVAINGTFSYATTQGAVSYPWTQSVLGAIASALNRPPRYLAPGAETAVPPVPLNVTTGNATITNVSVQVTGIVFADGTVWGETGEALRKRLLDHAAASKLDLEYKVLPTYSRLTPAEFEREIKSGPITAGQIWLNGTLQKALLDGNGRLRTDALERLKKMIANLENPFVK